MLYTIEFLKLLGELAIVLIAAVPVVVGVAQWWVRR